MKQQLLISAMTRDSVEVVEVTALQQLKEARTNQHKVSI